MTDRELIRLAHHELTPLEFQVWIASHYQHYGRRAGSHVLGVSESTYRYHLVSANRKIERSLIDRLEESA